MKRNSAYVMILIASPAEAAGKLAKALIGEATAACVQITQPVKSVYFWEGAVHEEEEVLLFVKTAMAKVGEVKRIVATLHPYKVPEVIVFDVTDGNQAYFRWIDEVLARLPGNTNPV
jgi:periplasmic divalent cation tolerance protein